ncbi:hypothetical protein [Paracidovorax wautersii]|uniref:hypothetical protein n=1 Tax=Paracidovorax wautersii TaxID=1177982 RepID=UPI0011139DF7|nr:hypothetical protein [Paracidovorax wautersii]
MPDINPSAHARTAGRRLSRGIATQRNLRNELGALIQLLAPDHPGGPCARGYDRPTACGAFRGARHTIH